MFHHHQMGPPGYEGQYPVPPGQYEQQDSQPYGYNSEPTRQIARNSQSQTQPQQQQYDPAFPLDSGPVPPTMYNHQGSHQLRPPGPMQGPSGPSMQAPSSYYGSTSAGGPLHYPGIPPARYSDEMFSSAVNTPRPIRFNPGEVPASSMEMPMPYYGGRPADPRQDSSAARPSSWDYQSDPYGRVRPAGGGDAPRGQVPAVNPPPPPPTRPAPVSGSEVDQFLAAYRKSTEQRYFGLEASGSVQKAQDSRQYTQGPHEQRNPAEAFSRRPSETTKTYDDDPVYRRRRDLDDPMESGINPPPPESGGRNEDPDVSTFQRKVTHVEGEIGFAGTDLFFQMSKIIGNVRPQKGDSVVVKAERVHSMPFDWNALSVEVLSSPTEKSNKSSNKKDEEDTFEQIPLMLPSTQQSKPLKSILKNKPAPPPPVISQQPSKTKIDYHHKKRTPSPEAARYEDKVSRRSPSPKRKKFSPERRLRSPDPYSRLPDTRSRSPGPRGRSPGRRSGSPGRCSKSPGRRSRSPGPRLRSPPRRTRSPLRLRSPDRRSRSPPPRKRSPSPVIIRRLSPPRGFSPPKLSEKPRDLSPVVRRIPPPPPPRESSPLSPIVVFRRRTPSPNAYFCISPTSGLRRKPPSPYLPKRSSPGPDKRTSSPGLEVRRRSSPGPEIRRKSPSSPASRRRKSSSSSSSDSGRRKKSKSKKSKSNRSRSSSPRGRSRRSPSPLRRKRSTSRSRRSTSRSRRSTSRSRRSTSRSRRSTSRTRYRSLSPLKVRRPRSRSVSPEIIIEQSSTSKGRTIKAATLPKPLKKKAPQEVTIVRVPQKAPPPPEAPKEKPRPMSLAFNWAKSAKEPPMLTGGLVKKPPAKKGPRQQLPAFKVVETKQTDAEKLEEIKKKIQVEKLKLAGEKLQEEKKRLKAAVAAHILEKKSGQGPPPVAPIAPSPSLMPTPASSFNPNIYPNPHYSNNMMGQSYYQQPGYQVPYNNFGQGPFPMYNEGYSMGGRSMGGPMMNPMMHGPMFPGPQLMPPVQPRPEVPAARLFRSTMDSIRGIRTALKPVSTSKPDSVGPPGVYGKVSAPQVPAKVSPQVPAKVSPQVPPKVSPQTPAKVSPQIQVSASKSSSKAPEKAAPAITEKPQVKSRSSSEKLRPPGEDNDDDVKVISIKTSEKVIQLEQGQAVKAVSIKPEVEVIQLEPPGPGLKEPEPDEIDDEIDIMEPTMAFELGCHPDKTSRARNWMICVRCAQRGHLISMCDKVRIPRALPFEISQAREMLVDSKREHLEEVAKLKGNESSNKESKKTGATKGDVDNNISSEVSKTTDDGKRTEQEKKRPAVQQDKIIQQDKVLQQEKPKVLSSKLTKSTREKFEQEMMMQGLPPARRPIRPRNSSVEERRETFVVQSSGPVPVKPVFRISRRRSVSPYRTTDIQDPMNDPMKNPMNDIAVKQLELEELSLRDMEIEKKMQILRMQKGQMKFSGWSGEDERPDPFCYICFKRGHKAAKCHAPCPSWIRLRVRVRDGMLVERAPGQMEPFCLACGKCGHFTRSCYQRQPYEVYSDDD